MSEIEELRGLVALGRERGYLTFEQIAATLEEVEITKEQVSGLHAHLVEHGVDVIAEDGVSAYKEQRGAERPTGSAKKAELDLTVEPSLDSLRLYLRSIGQVDLLDRRPGGRTGEADRARRHARQAADGRGQPAPRRLDRQRLSGPRPELPRPDPGGLAGADPGGGEVRLPPRLQVLHLRDLVDPPGGDAGDRRQGADDPHPRPHGREAEPGRPRRAPAGAEARARARAGGDRRGAALAASPTCGTSCASRSCRSRWRNRSATRTNPSSATSSPTTPSLEPFEEASEHLQKEGVRRALDALPERERQVIELRYGLSGARAADARGGRAARSASPASGSARSRTTR